MFALQTIAAVRLDRRLGGPHPEYHVRNGPIAAFHGNGVGDIRGGCRLG